MTDPTTWREAMDLALEWASGRRSHTNIAMNAEANVANRTHTLAMIAAMDAYEVSKWTAVAEGFAARERAHALLAKAPHRFRSSTMRSRRSWTTSSPRWAASSTCCNASPPVTGASGSRSRAMPDLRLVHRWRLRRLADDARHVQRPALPGDWLMGLQESERESVPSWAACLRRRCGCAPGTGCAVERHLGAKPMPEPNQTCTRCEPFPGDPCVCGGYGA